jgi:uncharacterized protein
LRSADLLLAADLVATALIATPSLAQRPDNLRLNESVWTPAATPPDGMTWDILESTREIQRRQAGTIYSRPAFSASVQALIGKRIKVSGYVMPLQNAQRQTHFVLLA